MSQEIVFRTGHPIQFVATKSFQLGETGMKLHRGDQLGFDGSQMTLQGHPPRPMPQLRGAMKYGWIVPLESFDENDMSALIPVSAGVQVRAADGGNPMDNQKRQAITTTSVSAEEREVQNVAAHAARTAARNNSTTRTGSENRSLPAGSVQIEAQEGIPVRSLRTPARQDTDLSKTSVYEAVSRANAVKIEPGQGRTREDLVAAMDPETRAVYEAELEARKASKGFYNEEEQGGRVVRQVGSPGVQEREGMRLTGSVGGGTAIAEVGGSGGQPVVSETVVEGIKMTNTNGPGSIRPIQAQVPAPAPAQAAGDPDQARMIARSICPDFPDNYVFTDPTRKKIARLQADYDNRPDVIRAVAAADTSPEVRQRLIQEFPEAFGA